MKNQKGFTLIELLLVLAIIGIISAIAIPALLGQRARARDKSARANAENIIADIIGTYDKLKDSGATPANGAALVGTAAAPIIPQFWTATNPWATAGALTGYAAAVGTENTTTPGTTTEALAVVGKQGQTFVGYLPPAAGANGVVASSVYLSAAFSVAGASTNNFTKVAGVD